MICRYIISISTTIMMHFSCAELQAFKWDNFVTLRDGLRMLSGDGCLWVFKHEDPITFGDNVDDWLLDGFRISSFTCGILAALWFRLQVAIEHGLRTS